MLQEKKALLSMRDSREEVAELMVSYDEIYETFLSHHLPVLPWCFHLASHISSKLPRSSPTEGLVPWLGALIVEFRSIMGLMMSAGEASLISRGTSGGGQTEDKTLSLERETCPHCANGKRGDTAIYVFVV